MIIFGVSGVGFCFSGQIVEVIVFGIETGKFDIALRAVESVLEYLIVRAVPVVPNPFLLPDPKKDVIRNGQILR